MVSKTNIFLVTKDKKTIESVNNVSDNGSTIRVDQILGDASAIENYHLTSGVTAGIVDIDPNSEEVLMQLQQLHRKYPQMCTVVVSEAITQDRILSAMQAGARHYMQKGSIHKDLSAVMGRLLEHPGTSQTNGSVLTVFSASGGCGATTVALNLAMEMRMSTEKPVLMIDLDHFYGAASSYLDINSEYGIEDVLTHDGKIDPNLIQSSSCSYKDDFHVLLSPAGTNNRPKPDVKYENLKQVVEVCRQTYAHTVIDAPRLDEETVKNLSELSDFTIVVFQLTLKDLKFARSIISTFKELGLSDKKIIPLANRFQRRGALLNAKEGQKVLGTQNLYHIRSDWRNAVNCINRGKTLAEVAPRSGIRKDFQKLVSEIQTNKPHD
jgi:pilus assembly protein CpaE